MSDSSVSSASDSNVSTQNPPQGNIHLILFTPSTNQELEEAFYLRIPITLVPTLCLKPIKYLRFLGLCILGRDGFISRTENGEPTDDDEALDDRGCYYYVLPNINGPLTSVVDMEVIRLRSNVSSESTASRNIFREDLMERDGRCIFSGFPSGMRGTDAAHIIPYTRGDEWVKLIVENRSRPEGHGIIQSINDIRNGFIAAPHIHSAFDSRIVAILKTPNSILTTEDVPLPPNRTLHHSVEYPQATRFTLQLLTPGMDEYATGYYIGSDAAFLRGTNEPLPSEVLLHYNYGAAAVRCWGHGIQTLASSDHVNIPRPVPPAPVEMGPQRTVNDRMNAINKRSRFSAGFTGGTGGGAHDDEWNEPSDDKHHMDADEIVLMFWTSSKASRERREEAKLAEARRIDDWRKNVEI